MFKSRRKFIKSIVSLTAYSLTMASGLLHSSLVHAQWLNESFKATNYEQLLQHLFVDVEFIDSRKIKFQRLPRVAENGAVVPIKITSSLENVSKISLLVEKNPHPLIAEFYFSAKMEPSVTARFKMAEASAVIVIIEADGKFYRKSKYVKVTVGGCGG